MNVIVNNDRSFLVFIIIKIPCEILPHIITIAHKVLLHVSHPDLQLKVYHLVAGTAGGLEL